jgi:hypothetical protein
VSLDRRPLAQLIVKLPREACAAIEAAVQPSDPGARLKSRRASLSARETPPGAALRREAPSRSTTSAASSPSTRPLRPEATGKSKPRVHASYIQAAPLLGDRRRGSSRFCVSRDPPEHATTPEVRAKERALSPRRHRVSGRRTARLAGHGGMPVRRSGPASRRPRERCARATAGLAPVVKSFRGVRLDEDERRPVLRRGRCRMTLNPSLACSSPVRPDRGERRARPPVGAEGGGGRGRASTSR